MEAVFYQKFPWAILPYKVRIDKKPLDEVAEIYDEGFRWLRRRRRPEMCWPWRIAQEAGWVIPSPADVRIAPFQNAEVCLARSERKDFLNRTGYAGLSERPEGNLLAVDQMPWLHLNEVRMEGGWQSMFTPLGDGYVEWILGWEAELPPGYHLYMYPAHGMADLEIECGILSGRNSRESDSERFNVSLAVRARKPVSIRRGQPLARFLILHADSLQMRGRMVRLGSESGAAPEESAG